MEDWMNVFETVSNGIEQFFQDVSKDMSEAIDALLELTDEFAEELDRTISPKLDQIDDQIVQWIEPMVLALTGLESTIDQAVEPVTHTVEPLLNQHPVCVGCRHYHGHSYNGVMLVCAMHPYGIVDGSDVCPDKEATTWRLPSQSQFPNDSF
jgi:gas vesicle protein